MKGDKSYNVRIGTNNLSYMEGKYTEKSSFFTTIKKVNLTILSDCGQKIFFT